MIISENISLKPYNTFGIEATASIFAEVQTLTDIQILCNNQKFREKQKLILGGGSNILFTKDYDGIIIKINTKGILKTKETKEHVFLNVQSGEIWDDFVNFCLQNNYCGVENLILIPGNVGTCPIQNIGAYGVEVKDIIESVEVLDINTLQMYEISNNECHFGYRDSIFKHELYGKLIILSVTFRLNKTHILNFEYNSVKEELHASGISKPNIHNVAQAIKNIRQKKLPDPKDIGNAGSFFKNPSVTENELKNIKSIFPDIPYYVQLDNSYKIPAAWLIEQCGWKGYCNGDAGVHKNQALILVNYGNATGKDILNLAIKIQESVLKKFGLKLETEVNII